MEWYQKTEKTKVLMKQSQDLIKIYKKIKINLEDIHLENTEEYRLFIDFVLKSIEQISKLIEKI